MDIFVIGECEEVLPEIVEAYKAHRSLPREELLLKMANIRGLYVPRFYESLYQEHSDPLYECPDERFKGCDRRMLKEVVPKISRVAVLENPANPGTAPQLRAAKGAAQMLGLRLQLVEARDPSAID